MCWPGVTVSEPVCCSIWATSGRGHGSGPTRCGDGPQRVTRLHRVGDGVAGGLREGGSGRVGAAAGPAQRESKAHHQQRGDGQQGTATTDAGRHASPRTAAGVAVVPAVPGRGDREPRKDRAVRRRKAAPIAPLGSPRGTTQGAPPPPPATSAGAAPGSRIELRARRPLPTAPSAADRSMPACSMPTCSMPTCPMPTCSMPTCSMPAFGLEPGAGPPSSRHRTCVRHGDI